MDSVSAFILSTRTKVPEVLPNPDAEYDFGRQIWICKATSQPLVLAMTDYARKRSPFGETSITESPEGTDVPIGISASPFGETIQTRAECEGSDRPTTMSASPFGETIVTNTPEGADRPMGGYISPFGETVMTKTSEGIDQSSENV